MWRNIKGELMVNIAELKKKIKLFHESMGGENRIHMGGKTVHIGPGENSGLFEMLPKKLQNKVIKGVGLEPQKESKRVEVREHIRDVDRTEKVKKKKISRYTRRWPHKRKKRGE